MEQGNVNDSNTSDGEAKTIGDNCRRFREARAWTQEHLAAAASVDVRTIQRMEFGARVGKETMLAVAGALAIDVAQLRQDERKMAADLEAFHKRYALIPLTVVARATELTQHLPYDFVQLDNHPLKDNVEEDARAAFHQAFDDAAIIWSELTALDRRVCENEIQDALDELERTGLVASVGTYALRLKNVDKPEMPRMTGTLLIITISDKNEPTLRALFDKKQEIRLGR